jgi:hypothetical protein
MCQAEFLIAAPRLCRVWCDFGNQFYLRIANQIWAMDFQLLMRVAFGTNGM